MWLAGLAEELGLKTDPGTFDKILNSLLRKIGFSKVFPYRFLAQMF